MDKFFQKNRFDLLSRLIVDDEFYFALNYKGEEILCKNKKEIENKKIWRESADIEEIKKYLYKCLDSFDYRVAEKGTIIFKKELAIIVRSRHVNTWKYLACNTNKSLWNDNLIKKYYDKWDDESWGYLSKNKSISWTKKMINKYSDRIAFYSLSRNHQIDIDASLFNKFYNKWDIRGLCANPQISKDSTLEEIILKHNDAYWYNKETGLLYFPEKFKHTGICSNTGIIWTVEKFEKHINNIDFWLLAKFGKLSNELIFKYGYLLNENRYIKDEHVKSSDWYDSYKVYINGWENLMNNESQIIDFELINYLANIKYNGIKVSGDARGGFSHFEVQRPVLDSINLKYCSLKISLDEFSLLDENKILKYFKYHIESIYINMLKSNIQKDQIYGKKVLKKYLDLILK